MSKTINFDLQKYLGTWYELIHYPSFFQRNDNYNTKAEYMMMPDGNVKVHNSTITQGKNFDSFGVAHQICGPSLRVDFAQSEVNNLTNSLEFKVPEKYLDKNLPNYVVDKLWLNDKDCYMYAVVTDSTKQSLYVLSRSPNPSLCDYNMIMQYVVSNYDRDRLVQTPHFK